MPRKRVRKSTVAVILGGMVIVLFAVLSLFVALWKYVQETPEVVVIPILFVVMIPVIWLFGREADKERAEQQRQELLLQREKEEKAREEMRVSEILTHEDEWGEEMCRWLIQNQYELIDARTAAIMNKYQEWGKETCQSLLQQKLAINDTDEMVRLALGEPTSIDEKTTTEKDHKVRWIYGTPRQGAVYIWFKDGKVTKISSMKRGDMSPISQDDHRAFNQHY